MGKTSNDYSSESGEHQCPSSVHCTEPAEEPCTVRAARHIEKFIRSVEGEAERIEGRWWRPDPDMVYYRKHGKAGIRTELWIWKSEGPWIAFADVNTSKDYVRILSISFTPSDIAPDEEGLHANRWSHSMPQFVMGPDFDDEYNSKKARLFVGDYVNKTDWQLYSKLFFSNPDEDGSLRDNTLKYVIVK